MAYYIFIEDNKINGCGCCRQLTEGVQNIEVTQEVYEAYLEDDLAYIWDGEEIIENPNYAADKAQRERQELDSLCMTRGDMFEALILAFGKTKSDIRTLIENYPGLSELERSLYLNRFDEALDFYRGYPAINLIGAYLGVSSDKLDRFFQTKDYHDLLPDEEPEEE